MPGTVGFPFRRLLVDHLIRGETRVWWEMDSQFRDPPPHVFQLQVGATMNANALDWVDVGTPITDGYYAVDDERRPSDFGKTLTTHYRVRLSTSLRDYVSEPTHTFGLLDERDWLLSRELIRKEQLRHRLVSVDGWLLRRLRFGEKCTRCADALTDEPLDSKCVECQGVGFKVGYHPPIPLAVDMNPEAIIERRTTEPPGPSRPTDQQIRILGFPTVSKYDVWVDGRSDQRWAFDGVHHLAEWRHVPLVVQANVKLLAFTHAVYGIAVGGEPPAPTTLPKNGPGDFCVDHDYGGPDSLAYVDSCGRGIVGASVRVFRQSDYAAGRRTPDKIVAAGGTLANGRWSHALCLCCGEAYVLVFEKTGCFAPTAVDLRIPCPGESSSRSSSFSSAASLGPQ